MREHGDLSRLTVAEVPTPMVDQPGDVRVRLRAAALNHLDLWTLRGLPGLSLDFPHVLGGDGAGIVDEVGGDVTRVRPGDRVMLNPGLSCHRCDYCLAGEHSLCREYRLLGEHVPGTLAEYIVVPEWNLAPIPLGRDGAPSLSWAEAAAFSLVSLTAWRMLVTKARLRPGETVLVWGIGGGVSVTALRIAKLCGARVIATSSSDAKLEKARELGADVTINHVAENVVKRVRALTDRRGVDIVVELLGSGGRLITCGATTGPKAELDLRRLFWFQWTIMGSTMGGCEDYRQVVRLLDQGQLRPIIDATYPLSRAREAFERLERGEQLGKIVVEIDA
jgi:NADPH:quinone reductase-like Zn-dependent oxidoreductase